METKTNEIANAVVLTEEQELVLERVNQGAELTKAEQLCLLDMPEPIRKETFDRYISDCLGSDVEYRLFELPKEYLIDYATKCYFSDESELKIFNLPEPTRTEVLSAYLSHGCFEDKLLSKVKELSDESKIQLIKRWYDIFPFRDDAELIFMINLLPNEWREKILSDDKIEQSKKAEIIWSD